MSAGMAAVADAEGVTSPPPANETTTTTPNMTAAMPAATSPSALPIVTPREERARSGEQPSSGVEDAEPVPKGHGHGSDRCRHLRVPRPDGVQGQLQ